MSRHRSSLLLALLGPLVVAWSVAVDAQSCANGSVVYVKSNSATTGLSCSSNSACHGPTASKNKIQNAARNPAKIDEALAGIPGNEVMTALNLRVNLPLSPGDIVDLAEWIYWAGTLGACPPANAPLLSASPSSWDFGSVSAGGTSAARSFVVTNFGGVAASGLTFANADDTKWIVTGNTCGGTINANGGTCDLSIAYAPAAAGASDTGTYSGSGSGSFSISLSGSSPSGATPANLQVAPGAATFGNVTVGASSATLAFTVTNSGGTGAAGMVFANTNGAEFIVSGNTCAATLAAGARCGFSLKYTPSAVGADTATLSLAYSGAATINIAMSGTGTAPPVAALQVTPATLAFGTVALGSTSATQNLVVANTGGATATALALANGDALHFPVSGNTCGATLAAGASCTLNVAYAPTAVGTANAALTFSYAGGTSVNVAMTGTGSAAPTANLATVPAVGDFGSVSVGQSSAPLAVTLANSGTAAAGGLTFGNTNSAEFGVGGNTCGTSLAAGASCAFTLTFTPSAAGASSATLTISHAGGGAVVMALSGVGTASTPPPPPPPTAATVDLVEYFHAEFGHYFITYLADEIAKLDNGTFKGWARTGRQFKAWTLAATGLSPVCRFFTVAFAPKSSHFYTPYAPECAVVKTNSVWTFEGEVFYTQQANLVGACPPGTVPVYRMYNNGQTGAPNHRYTTDLAVRAQMLAQGWIPEGAGDVGVIMCAPP